MGDGKMDKQITIYHGSEKNVERPIFGGGKKNNDFGPDFYCTESEELAKEWAVSSLRDGFANRYTLDAGGRERWTVHSGYYERRHSKR